MEIYIDYSDTTATIKITGRLDATNSHKLKEAFNKIDLSSHTDVILDFSLLEVIDSSGIGKILVFFKKVKENNRMLSIKNANAYVREVFNLTQLDRIIPIEP